jgi:hypothetical protein
LKILDLFCGTKSISYQFEKEEFETITLDIDPRFEPTICGDILDYDGDFFLDQYGKIEVVWGSPICYGFSRMSMAHHWKRTNKGYRPLTKEAIHGVKLSLHTLKLISEIKPDYWFIENPVGLLRKMPYMVNLPRYTISYCQYGDNRQKPTDIWGYFPSGFPIMSCSPGDPCHENTGNGSNGKGTLALPNRIERAMIPSKFAGLLARYIKNEIVGVVV